MRSLRTLQLLIVFLILGGGVFLLHLAQSERADQSGGKIRISAIVIPHHNLVKAQRQAFLHTVKLVAKQPTTVILISPNHYESGRAAIQTDSQVWHVSTGVFEPNRTVIDAIKTQAGVSEEATSFENEHGIRLVLDDVKDTFPQATIVPIIFKRATTQEQISQLEKVLRASCRNCLLVASVDFSHYQPALLAQLHDDVSERALDNRDIPTLMTTAEVDSPAALALMAAWANDAQTQQFVLKNHTDSGELSHSPDEESTSHFFGWYQTGQPTTPKKSVSFLIGGSILPGNSISVTSFDQLGERVFWGTDASIINLQGAGNDASLLKFLHASAADPSFNQPSTLTGQELRLKLIHVDPVKEPTDLSTLIRQLKNDPANRVLILPSWPAQTGATDTETQSAQAHDWIDAGADLVIGSAPNGIQDSELYRDKPIIYSVGNLLPNSSASKNDQLGLLLAGEFRQDQLLFFALPVEAPTGKPQLLRGGAKQTALDQFYQPFRRYLQAGPAGDAIVLPK